MFLSLSLGRALSYFLVRLLLETSADLSQTLHTTSSSIVLKYMAQSVDMQILSYGAINIKYDVDMALTLVVWLEIQECSYPLRSKLKFV